MKLLKLYYKIDHIVQESRGTWGHARPQEIFVFLIQSDSISGCLIVRITLQD